MLYICKDCREVFVQPDMKPEDYGWETDLGHVSAYQYYYICPICNSEDIDDKEDCCICGKECAMDELEYNIDGDLVCQDCLKSMNIYENKGDNEND